MDEKVTFAPALTGFGFAVIVIGGTTMTFMVWAISFVALVETLAVIVVEEAATVFPGVFVAVIRPVALTVATLVFADVHLTWTPVGGTVTALTC